MAKGRTSSVFYRFSEQMVERSLAWASVLTPEAASHGSALRSACCSRGVDEVPSSFAVERFGGHVEAVWPGDRSCLWVDLDSRKVGGIAERLEDALPFASGEVDVADGAVGEREPQLVIADHLDSRDVNELFHSVSFYGSGSIGSSGSLRRARSQLASSSS
jgi:hypothetical protein